MEAGVVEDAEAPLEGLQIVALGRLQPEPGDDARRQVELQHLGRPPQGNGLLVGRRGEEGGRGAQALKGRRGLGQRPVARDAIAGESGRVEDRGVHRRGNDERRGTVAGEVDGAHLDVGKTRPRGLGGVVAQPDHGDARAAGVAHQAGQIRRLVSAGVGVDDQRVEAVRQAVRGAAPAGAEVDRLHGTAE